MKVSAVMEFIKKYVFQLSLVVLTAALLIIFSYRNPGDIIEDWRHGLAGIFANTLRPMNVTNELSNEDVFNFAMYNYLPLNKKENKMLLIGEGENGSDSIRIENAKYVINNDKYHDFVKYLDLNPEKKAELDSILTVYKNKLYSIILSGENNRVAVNKNISILRNLLYADIAGFAGRTNSRKANELYAEHTRVIPIDDIKKLDGLVASTGKPQDYIVWDNDSVYSANLTLNYAQPLAQMKDTDPRMKEKYLQDMKVYADAGKIYNLEKNRNPKSASWANRENDRINIVVPGSDLPKQYEEELMRLKKNLPKLKSFFEIKQGPGSKGGINFNFDMNKVDSFIAPFMEMAYQNMSKAEKEKVKKTLDSALKSSKQEFRKKYKDRQPQKGGNEDEIERK